MRKWNNDDLFYVCSMIEFVARETHNKTKDIVAKLSDKELAHQLKAAGVTIVFHLNRCVMSGLRNME